MRAWDERTREGYAMPHESDYQNGSTRVPSTQNYPGPHGQQEQFQYASAQGQGTDSVRCNASFMNSQQFYGQDGYPYAPPSAMQQGYAAAQPQHGYSMPYEPYIDGQQQGWVAPAKSNVGAAPTK